MNKVILMGRLCADPEMRSTQSGNSICGLRIAVQRRFKNQQTGAYDTDFINCTAFRQTADFISRYFHKGSMIAVAGELRNNDFTDKSGVKHYSMYVQVDEARFCGKSESPAQSLQEAPQATYQPAVGNPSVPYAPAPTQPQSVPSGQVDAFGDLSGFETVLSDGEVPF